MTEFVVVTQHASSKGTDTYRSVLYTISPCYKGSMSSIAEDHLGMFRR